MAKIRVSKSIKKEANEAYSSLKNFFDNAEAPPFASELGSGEKPQMEWNDSERTGQFKAGKVHGCFSVLGNCPCTLEIEIELPIYMAPLKGMIEKTLKNHLEKI